VFYDLFGSTTLPAAAAPSASGGYYTTEIIGIDQAGNRTSPLTVAVVEDAQNPVITATDIPGTLIGGTTLSIPAFATDNVDLVASSLNIGYTGSAAMTLSYPRTAGPGVSFDNALTRSVMLLPSTSFFIRNLQQAAAPGVALSSQTSANDAKSVLALAYDEAGRVSGNTAITLASALANVNPEGQNSFNANFNGGFTLTASSNPVWNCPAPTFGQTTGCGAAGTSTPGSTTTVLSAVASGNTGVFTNPFSQVQYWYLNPVTGRWVLIGSVSSGSATVADTGVGQGRSFTYQFTWDPPLSFADGFSFIPVAGGNVTVQIRAIGINSSGDAVSTTSYALTITNT
jgi:hypothetical protein